ncbi:MAG: hypothetical protein IV092_07305 [Burkholderiaceae bacterium]|nr:hypothetical protein [Burkholderiaceae bacterium]
MTGIERQRAARARHGPQLQVLAVLGLAVLLVYGQTLFFDRVLFNVDQETHYRWIVQFGQTLREGGFYPRWMPRANLGLGELTYSAYLSYWYLAGGMVALGLDAWTAIKMLAGVGAIISGASVYLISRRLVSHSVAMLAMVFAVVAPMTTFLFSHYAAFPWNFSLCLVPAFLALSINENYSAKRFAALALCTALLTLTHVLVAFMAILSVFPAILLQWGRARKSHGARDGLVWGWAVLLGVLLAAFQLVPAVAARGLVNAIPASDAHYLDWRNSFAFPFFTAKLFGMRWFLIQWIHSSVILLAGCATLFALRFSSEPESRLRRVIQALALVSLTALFLASEAAYLAYKYIEPMRSVQWPYRFLSLASVAGLLALVLALALRYSPAREKNARRMIGVSLAVPLLLSVALQVQLWREGKPTQLNLALLDQNFHQHGLEFRTQGPNWGRYVADGGLAGLCDRQGAQCKPVTDKGHFRVWDVSSSKGAQLLLPAFAFPGWATLLDGQPSAHAIDPDTGLVSLDVPAGTHRVTLAFIGLPAERIGQAMSGAGLLALFSSFLLFWSRRRNRSESGPTR